MEKLGQLAATGKWDLIVVDTPPSRSALDFLDAPQRMSTFLDGRMIRLLSAPARAGGRGLRKVVGAGFSLFAKAVSTILGGQLLADASAFVQAFDTMFGGFRERATATYALLRSPGTAFLVVAAPEPDALREAAYFVDRLSHRGHAAGRPGAQPHAPGAGRRSRRRRPAPPRTGCAARPLAAAVLRLHADRVDLAAREDRLLARFTRAHPAVPVTRVPVGAGDVARPRRPARDRRPPRRRPPGPARRADGLRLARRPGCRRSACRHPAVIVVRRDLGQTRPLRSVVTPHGRPTGGRARPVVPRQGSGRSRAVGRTAAFGPVVASTPHSRLLRRPAQAQRPQHRGHEAADRAAHAVWCSCGSTMSSSVASCAARASAKSSAQVRTSVAAAAAPAARRSVIPPHTPNSMRWSSACARHSVRTGQSGRSCAPPAARPGHEQVLGVGRAATRRHTPVPP